MREQEILNRIRDGYAAILGDNLTGIYIHGSLAFGCFNWDVSDIDFLVVTEEAPSLFQKEELIRILLGLTPSAPPKGLEMSLVLSRFCADFVYPTPFELHFSPMHLPWALRDLSDYCRKMRGEDPDLAAHFTVTRHVGIVVTGKSIEEVFGDVPAEAYLDSICRDGEEAGEPGRDPVYDTLNLCRVLAYQIGGLVPSKEQGGRWGTEHVPAEYVPLVREALRAYQTSDKMRADGEVLRGFIQWAKQGIGI